MQSTPFIASFRALTFPWLQKRWLRSSQRMYEILVNLCKFLHQKTTQLCSCQCDGVCFLFHIGYTYITYMMEYWKANDKHICVFCYNKHGSIVTGSMFGVKQHVCVSFILSGSKFINDIRAILSDFETLFPICHEKKFAAKLLWIYIIYPYLAKKFDEVSFTCWTSQQSPSLLYVLIGNNTDMG